MLPSYTDDKLPKILFNLMAINISISDGNVFVVTYLKNFNTKVFD